MHSTKRFYSILIIAVLIAGGAFVWQLSKANKITVKPSTTPLFNSGYSQIDTNEDVVLGNPGAPLTIVMFSDFVCEDCRAKYAMMKDFVKKHPQDARLFLKYSPSNNLLTKPNDWPYRSAICAGKQDKFWKFTDELNSAKKISTENDLLVIAKNLNLDIEKWTKCNTAQTTQQLIDKNIATSQSLGIKNTPVFYFNNKLLNIDKDLDLNDLLNKLIAK